jgi:uncharacterized oligopeptide transporter (OPT) family protein
MPPHNMFDPFFTWLESTALSRWLVESTSVFAFPLVLALHTIGLALLVGLNAALDFRVLGVAPHIPVTAFGRFLPVMWAGFWLNAVSGVLLLVAYPTKALTNPVFYLKLGLIGVATAILLAVKRRLLLSERTPASRPGRVKLLALVSLVCWAGAITAGRLLAYTYNRLTVTRFD